MWKKLIDFPELKLERGYLIKFPAKYPFEDFVVMMVCGYPENGKSLSAAGLITITGYNSGINSFVVFPDEVCNKLSNRWLIENWNKWIFPEGGVKDVLVREPLQASEL